MLSRNGKACAPQNRGEQCPHNEKPIRKNEIEAVVSQLKSEVNLFTLNFAAAIAGFVYLNERKKKALLLQKQMNKLYLNYDNRIIFVYIQKKSDIYYRKKRSVL
jgi:hypothetical protein